ncbi:MAG TPA: FkbM family methyltransferase [Gemmatales bacterium]|nr:FkbM family methyltransferase [Gemmatales bacterium]
MTLQEVLNHDRGFVEGHSRKFAKAFMMGDKLCTRLLGGPIMFCDPSNYDFTPWLGLEGFWESWVSMAIGRAIQPGWVCYDVGAAWGYYSLLMAGCGADQVVAVEALPHRVPYIELNMKTNFYNLPWDVVEAAVGNGSKVNVNVLPGLVGNAFDSGRHELDSVPFDRICQTGSGGKADLLKVDIDGGELAFWDGVQGTIASNPNLIIVMEVNSQRYDAKSFYQRINDVFPVLRVVTTDGGTRQTTVDELVAISTTDQMIWLQR